MPTSRYALLVAAVAVAGLNSCSKPGATVAAEPEKEVRRIEDEPRIDACSLLTSAEIESVQGEAVQEAKPSQPPGNAYRVSQCYFALPSHTNSIVVTITQRGSGPGAKDPKMFWEETFGERANENSKERAREEGEKKAPPLKVDGIGDEALWAGNSIGGALYVLQGNAYLRVSVGGTDQLEKTKKLAALALKHL